HERQEQLEREPWAEKLRSPAAWSDAASYTMADLTMLRKELVIGYLVAGVLAVVVPMQAWNDVFLTGHGFWTSLENVIVGPFIAFISFVCSVGNVPMAAALWHGGISFGGVISFIFADLIALPLVLIYRKFYGPKLTWRLFGLFWLVMAAAGLIVEGLFAVLHLIPKTRPDEIVHTGFQWNYTTYLNIVFLAVFAGLFWLHRNRARFGGGRGYAIDPVCGMQVQTANAPARAEQDGQTYFFCSDRCHERFESDPSRFANAAPDLGAMDPEGAHGHGHSTGDVAGEVDPVCGMSVDPRTAAAHRTYAGREVSFCSTQCAEMFDQTPSHYAEMAPATDPVCGMTVEPGAAAAHRYADGVEYSFCSLHCAATFDEDPSRYRSGVSPTGGG
ncbi:MAG: uncharacterized protein QOG64_2374, partial [Acidimicrobiaceae bacterium]|nr:uncharacterized protein [Acidimicrobiaceae bacterium]